MKEDERLININGKQWEKIELSDVENLLKTDDDETFFFEFKNDDVSIKKIIKEISAFANTYGGYIFIGIDDNKNISGCTNWNEQKIHTTIHDSLTPIPDFDVKKLTREDGIIIYIIKINEGTNPPYITNSGIIYERVSSGSFPINDSSKLTQLYYKREEQFKKIQKKIEIDENINNANLPQNLCGYLDIGFSVNINNLIKFQEGFFNINLEELSKRIKQNQRDYSITKVGYSIVVTMGKVTSNEGRKNVLISTGIHDFIEIMCDGSARCRILLIADENDTKVSISELLILIEKYKEIYEFCVGKEFYTLFMNAYKYEKLVVLKQFEPYFKISAEDPVKNVFDDYVIKHKEKYGNNIIINGNRIPKNDYVCIDKRYFNSFKLEFNNENLISELFLSQHKLLGFIDDFPRELI